MTGLGNVTSANTMKNDNYSVITKSVLLLNGSRADVDSPTRSEKAPAFWVAFMAYLQAIKGSGFVVDGAGLQPSQNGHGRPRAPR
jgi:hypothetical protein